MNLFDLNLETPEEHLACDEALLDLCERGESGELLRLWQPEQYFVVMGYANSVAREVDVDFCRRRKIPILRRCSGGGTVLQGRGCLNYSLVLRIQETQATRGIGPTNEFVLSRHRSMLSSLLGKRVEACGHTDLAIGGWKCSGNAQRRRKDFLLFHGCFLLNMDIALIAQALRMPSKEPAYRANRDHTEFLVNLEVEAGELKAALAECWGARAMSIPLPRKEIDQLVLQKYSRTDWNFRH